MIIDDINKDELLNAISKVNALSDHRVVIVTGLELFKSIEYFYGYEVIYTDCVDDNKILIIPKKNHPIRLSTEMMIKTT